jgi:hypothetical protein
MAGGGDGDGKLPPVDHDPLNEGAVIKIWEKLSSPFK